MNGPMSVAARRDRIMLSLLGDLKEGEQKLQAANATLERRVSERTAQIERALKDLEEFAYNVAHNLRAPLRSMNGHSQLLLRDHSGGLDEVGRKYLGQIAASSQTLDDMISDLLSYYQLACETHPCGPIELAPILDCVIQELDKRINDLRAVIRVEKNLPRVVGNKGLLRQVLAHLLSNALTFTAPGVPPVIDIKADRRGLSARIWVEDDGIGIAPEHQERIFQVFERLNRVEDYPGNGIGLSIVRRAVELMDGRAGVESVAGRASRFWFELKRAEL